MQKRSLVFLFILSISLLVVNVFFKPDKAATNQKKTELARSNNKTLESRVAVQAGLPLVDIYKDQNAKTYLTSGLLFEGKLLTLQWDDKLPEEVFYKKSHSSFPTKVATLQPSDSHVSDPVIFESQDHEGKLTAADLPSKGSVEVQLVHPRAYSNNPSIFSSYFSNGSFNSIGEINGNAIAVAKTQDGYEPIGIYLGSEAKLISLKDFFNLKPLISSHKAQFQTAPKEHFYVLENDYQQLVFSNVGGALAEINLPVHSDKHPNSLVRTTPQDQKFEKNLFPAKDAANADAKEGGYYPLIRRSTDPVQTNPRYYAFNLVSSYPGLSEQSYNVKQHSKDKITFELNQNYRKITKTFTLDPSSPYGFNVDIKVNGDHSDLWVTTGVPEAEAGASQQQPILKYRHLKKNKFDISKQKLPKSTSENREVSPDWISNSNGFFTVLVDPQTKMGPGYKVNKVTSNQLASRIDADAPAKKRAPGYEFLLPLSKSDSDTNLKVYAGPLENGVLKTAQGSSSNYLGAQSYHGFLPFISEPCAKLLFVLMNGVYKVTHSWGLSIILLTVLLRLILYPLNSWSIKSMRKNQEIAPEISAIQKKYKKNPKQAQIETMQLYRKRKVNPLTGCLPMLIQMPFLIGMFNLLRSAFVLRGVSFIPGWINNLTAPDVLFSWAHSLPIIGTEFHLLPILSGIMIWVQQKMTSPTPKDKSLMTDQQKQQKMIGNMMVLFISLVCYNMPSGLNLYWISASLLGILQQWITNRILDKKKSKPTILTKKKAALKES